MHLIVVFAINAPEIIKETTFTVEVDHDKKLDERHQPPRDPQDHPPRQPEAQVQHDADHQAQS